MNVAARQPTAPNPLFWPLALLAALQVAFGLFWIGTLGAGPDVQPTFVYAAVFALLAWIAYRRALPLVGDAINGWIRAHHKLLVAAVVVALIGGPLLSIGSLSLYVGLVATLFVLLCVAPERES